MDARKSRDARNSRDVSHNRDGAWYSRNRKPPIGTAKMTVVKASNSKDVSKSGNPSKSWVASNSKDATADASCCKDAY
jgi:hypothetical protein